MHLNREIARMTNRHIPKLEQQIKEKNNLWALAIR
jgi:hypothetical protein